jgi:hypothetical protein
VLVARIAFLSRAVSMGPAVRAVTRPTFRRTGVTLAGLLLTITLPMNATPTFIYTFTTQELIAGINSLNASNPAFPSASQAVFYDFNVQPVLQPGVLTNYVITQALSPIPLITSGSPGAPPDSYQTNIYQTTSGAPTTPIASPPANPIGNYFARFFVSEAQNSTIAFVTTAPNINTGNGHLYSFTAPDTLTNKLGETMSLLDHWQIQISTTDPITASTPLSFLWVLEGHTVTNGGALTNSKSFQENFDISKASVPEPQAFVLLAMGLASLGALRLRLKRRTADPRIMRALKIIEGE